MLVLFCFGFFFHTVSCGGKFQARRLKVLAKEGHTQARKGQGDESTSMLIGNFYLLVTWPLRKGRTASLFSSSCRLHPFPAACLAPRDHPDPSAVGCRSPSPGSPVPPSMAAVPGADACHCKGHFPRLGGTVWCLTRDLGVSRY